MPCYGVVVENRFRQCPDPAKRDGKENQAAADSEQQVLAEREVEPGYRG